jgi:hypothetical protein
MVPPSVVIKDGMGGRRFARSFSWSAATERLVNAIFVVKILGLQANEWAICRGEHGRKPCGYWLSSISQGV